jgi:hypothetical protein
MICQTDCVFGILPDIKVSSTSENAISFLLLPEKSEQFSRHSEVLRTGFRAWTYFSLLHRVQAGSGVHPASYPIRNGDDFPRGKPTEA